MNTLLEGAYWPETLETHVLYARRHDDTDGETEAKHDLTVGVGSDGDVWVVQAGYQTLRFRTGLGGGQSPRVRNALLVLAEAIRRDNDEFPQAGEVQHDVAVGASSGEATGA